MGEVERKMDVGDEDEEVAMVVRERKRERW